MSAKDDKEKTRGEADADEEGVGYKHPPKHSRFRPGHSGNPRGRPEGSRNLKTVLAAAMRETVTIRTANGPKKIKKLEALVQKTFNDALTGDLRATRLMLEMLTRTGLDCEMDEAIADASNRALSEEDRTILARYLGPSGTEQRNLDE